MLGRAALCFFLVLLFGATPSFSKGGHKEGGLVRCGKFGCHGLMDSIDPIRKECADKVGATFNVEWRHFDGPPAVMDAWRKCVGLPPFMGPEPERVHCASQTGARWNDKTRHFQGSPDVMDHFRSCLGY